MSQFKVGEVVQLVLVSEAGVERTIKARIGAMISEPQKFDRYRVYATVDRRLTTFSPVWAEQDAKTIGEKRWIRPAPVLP